MKPSQVSSTLRRIAAKIDNSKRPDPTLVAKDLKRIISHIAIAEEPEELGVPDYDAPGHPKFLKENEFQIYSSAFGGTYIMYHKAHGKLWKTESDDPDSFDPNDAEEIDPEGFTTTGMDLVKSGMMN